jgi:SdrD B-like protein
MRRNRRESLTFRHVDSDNRLIASTGLPAGAQVHQHDLRNVRRRCARRFTPLAGETLEPRQLLAGTASIAGTVWNDLDGDRSRGGSEPAASGITIYLDLNDNNALDAAEPTRVTAADGSYSFQSLDAGSYVVRELAPANHPITSPQASGPRLFVLKGAIDPSTELLPDIFTRDFTADS